MTPDAWSNATLADVKRGGVLRRTDLQLHLFGNKQVGEMTSTVLWAFLGSLTTRYAGHSRVKGEDPVQTVVMVTPKDLLVTCVRLTTRVLQTIV